MAVKNPYNGYSPKERDAKYKALKKLIASGDLLQAKGPCDLCNDPEVSVEYHYEDYSLPYLWTKPALLCLCRYCHRSKLHRRFNNPGNWYSFLAHIRRGGYASDLKNKDIDKEVKSFQVAQKNNVNFKLKVIRPYQHAVGSEWFASIRMDIESLQDPKARPRK